MHLIIDCGRTLEEGNSILVEDQNGKQYKLFDLANEWIIADENSTEEPSPHPCMIQTLKEMVDQLDLEIFRRFRTKICDETK